MQWAIVLMDVKVGAPMVVLDPCLPDDGCPIEPATAEDGWGLLSGIAVSGSLDLLPNLALIDQYDQSRTPPKR